ncbi:Bifunctional autolysin [Staphylococcus aureus]|nr:Bifunctional autolysin [Staphylococcus aureus]
MLNKLVGTQYQKAIVGGAKFIGNSYVKAGQNTLYKMRWNPAHPGTHQYATDVDWANINAKIIKGYYDKIWRSRQILRHPTI